MDRVILSRIILQTFPPVLDLFYRGIIGWIPRAGTSITLENASTIQEMLISDANLTLDLCEHYDLMFTKSFTGFITEWNTRYIFTDQDIISEYRQLHWREVVNNYVNKTHEPVVLYNPGEIEITLDGVFQGNRRVLSFEDFTYNCKNTYEALILFLSRAAEIEDIALINLVLHEECLWFSENHIAAVITSLPSNSPYREKYIYVYRMKVGTSAALDVVNSDVLINSIRDHLPLLEKSPKNFYMVCLWDNMEDRYFNKSIKDIEMYHGFIDMNEPSKRQIESTIVNSYNLRALLKYQAREKKNIGLNGLWCSNAAWTKYVYFTAPHVEIIQHTFAIHIFIIKDDKRVINYKTNDYETIETSYDRISFIHDYIGEKNAFPEVTALLERDKIKAYQNILDQGNDHEPYITRHLIDIIGFSNEVDKKFLRETIDKDDVCMLAWIKLK